MKSHEIFSDWPAQDAGIDTIDAAFCDSLMCDAQTAPRKRAHLLLHDSHDDSVQRLLVAFSHNTYIQPHQHSRQWEMVVPLRGQLALLLFGNDGTVTGREVFSAETKAALQIPAGVWHTLFAVTPTALMLEIKPGPFRLAEFCNWAPSEGAPDSVAAVRWLASAQPGARWPGCA